MISYFRIQSFRFISSLSLINYNYLENKIQIWFNSTHSPNFWCSGVNNLNEIMKSYNHEIVLNICYVWLSNYENLKICNFDRKGTK